MTDDIEQLPDGVYLNLPDRIYFGQKGRRGSSDWMKIDQRKLGWWWQSEHNPRHKAPKTVERTYGSALHAIMLEGKAAYEGRFFCEPDPADYKGLCTTIPEMKAALTEGGFDLTGSSKWLAPDWALRMYEMMPNRPCWPNIYADFKVDLPQGAEIITAEEDEMLRLMHAMALEDDRPDNRELRNLFAEVDRYPPLAEVSIFWTDQWGTKRRARIDRMFPKFDMDLKSLGNWRGRPLKFEVGELIARNRWFMQRADYREAREVAYEFILEGKVSGATVDQQLWLQRWPTEFPKWDWVWLAYQKPDSVKGLAPIVMPVWDDAYNRGGGVAPLLQHGHERVLQAQSLYRRAVAEFGLDKPWGRVEPLHFTDETEPRVIIPHYVQELDAPEEAAYAAE